MGRAGALFRRNPLAAGSAAMIYSSPASQFGHRCMPIGWPLWSTKPVFDDAWRTAAVGSRPADEPLDANDRISWRRRLRHVCAAKATFGLGA
jgi:hypothetical protein